MSGHPCFASLARLPDRSTPCRPASAEASNPLLAPRPIPSGIGMTKPTMQQARDRAELALYESWVLPLAVILIVPMCMLSALAGVAQSLQ